MANIPKPQSLKMIVTMAIVYFGLGGLALIGFGGFRLMRANSIAKAGTQTMATVVDVWGGRGSGSRYEYTVDGHLFWGIGAGSHHPGDRIPVAYMPDRPSNSTDLSESHLLNWMLIGIGVVAIGMAPYAVRMMRANWRKKGWPVDG